MAVFVDSGTQSVLSLLEAGVPIPPAFSAYVENANKVLAERAAAANQLQEQPQQPQQFEPVAVQTRYVAPNSTAPKVEAVVEAPQSEPAGLLDGLELTPAAQEEAAPASANRAELEAMISSMLKPITDTLAAQETARKQYEAEQAEASRKAALEAATKKLDSSDPASISAFIEAVVANTTRQQVEPQAPATTAAETVANTTPTGADPVSKAVTTLDTQMPGFKKISGSKEFATYLSQKEPGLGLATLSDRYIEALSMNTPESLAVVSNIVNAFVASQRKVPQVNTPAVHINGVTTSAVTPTQSAPSPSGGKQIQDQLKALAGASPEEFATKLRQLRAGINNPVNI